MATWLEEYTQLKTVAEQKIGSAQLTTSEMLGYQEVLYRIEVLEACKMFSKTSPVPQAVFQFSARQCRVLSARYSGSDQYGTDWLASAEEYLCGSERKEGAWT